MQERMDCIASKVDSWQQINLRDVATITEESVARVHQSLANVQWTVDNIKEELVELKMLAASNNVFRNGKLTWPIRNVSQRFEDARLGRKSRLFSPPFYSKPDGYKMCVCVYLNGCDNGEGTHLSVFFGLMKGEYDPLLQWPFEHKVSLTLVDQDNKDDVIRSFNCAELDGFCRPTNELDSRSGFTKFAPHSILGNLKYVKDDVMFIRAAVDPQNYILV